MLTCSSQRIFDPKCYTGIYIRTYISYIYSRRHGDLIRGSPIKPLGVSFAGMCEGPDQGLPIVTVTQSTLHNTYPVILFINLNILCFISKKIYLFKNVRNSECTHIFKIYICMTVCPFHPWK